MKAFTIQPSPTMGWAVMTRLPDERNYEALVRDGSGSSLIAACVMWIANAFTQAKPVAYRFNGEFAEVESDHPAAQLIRRPTFDPRINRSYYSWMPLMQATLTSFIIDGNAYWLKVRSETGQVVQLWYIPHWMIEPFWTPGSNNFIDYYRYMMVMGQAELRIQDVVHFRDGLDPNNTRKGLSKTKMLLREIYTDEEAARWTASLLHNQSVPGLVISPSSGWTIAKEDALAIKEDLKAKVSGDKRGEPIVLSGPTTVSQYGFSPEQMKLGDLRDIPEERVSSVVGIPAAVVGFGTGLQQTKVGATMSELVDIAWQNGVLPRARVIGAELTEQLLPDFADTENVELGFDHSKAPIMADYRLKEAQTLEYLMRWSIIRRGEARRRLELPQGVRDNVYTLSSGLTEVDANKSLAAEPVMAPIRESVAAPATPAIQPPEQPKALTEGKPIGPFPDFATCVSWMSLHESYTEEEARRICGAMERDQNKLTERQLEVKRLLDMGLLQKHIAIRMSISERTVEREVAAIKRGGNLADKVAVS